MDQCNSSISGEFWNLGCNLIFWTQYCFKLVLCDCASMVGWIDGIWTCWVFCRILNSGTCGGFSCRILIDCTCYGLSFWQQSCPALSFTELMMATSFHPDTYFCSIASFFGWLQHFSLVFDQWTEFYPPSGLNG
jgi:hypothetical protein